MNQNKIKIEAEIKAPVEEVWGYYISPENIIKWNNASEDWHTTSAVNDLRPLGTFNYRMEAKDGSAGFDFSGVYDEVVPLKLIEYTMDDGRKATVEFIEFDGNTKVIVTFDPESTNPIEFQRDGWQAILDNFKKYVEFDFEEAQYA